MLLLLFIIILLLLLISLFFYLFQGNQVQNNWKNGVKKAFEHNNKEREKILLDNDKKLIALMITKRWYSFKELKNIYMTNIESSAIDYIMTHEDKEINMFHTVSFRKQQILDLSNKRLEKRKYYLKELQKDYLDPNTPFDNDISGYIKEFTHKK